MNRAGMLIWNGCFALFFLSSARADTVYVWSGDGTIQKFGTNGVGTIVATNLDGGNGPVGLALDNVGNLYAGHPNSSGIYKFSPSGIRSAAGGLDSVSGLGFDNSGHLFATSPNYAAVVRMDSRAYTDYSQGHLTYPVNLGFDGANNVYVANGIYPYWWPYATPTNTIEKFSTNFTYLGAFATNLNNPSGLAFDSGDNLFVANSGTNVILKNTIVKFTTNGTRSTFATAANGLSRPQGLAFDSSGNLYVANSGNGTIQKFAANGTGSILVSGLTSPTSIAIYPGLKVWSATAVKLNSPKILTDGSLQFSLIENPGLTFTVLSTTNTSLPLSNWTALGVASEISSGQYQFTDPQTTNNPQRFYRVRSD